MPPLHTPRQGSDSGSACCSSSRPQGLASLMGDAAESFSQRLSLWWVVSGGPRLFCAVDPPPPGPQYPGLRTWEGWMDMGGFLRPGPEAMHRITARVPRTHPVVSRDHLQGGWDTG